MLDAHVVSPFSITYDGRDAEQHVISSRPLGHSIIGASQLYTAVVHYCMFGVVPRGNYKKLFECYAMPPRERCYEFQVLIAALGSEWVMHGPIYKDGLKFLFARLVDTLKHIWTKPGEVQKVVDTLAEVMKEQARANAEVNTVLANGLIRQSDNLASLHGKLIETLPRLAEVTRLPAARLVTPVGITCASLTQFARTPDASTINEAEAEVIRNRDLEVDDMRDFRCQAITEVDTVSGHCVLWIEGMEDRVVGKIADPALQHPNNVYTRALNDQTALLVTAKPVKKNGVIYRLYISDAKPV